MGSSHSTPQPSTQKQEPNEEYSRSFLLQPRIYKGKSTGIVFGIDVGTTYSGVSYAVLRPDKRPVIQDVWKYHNQNVGDNKIPSVIYYKGQEVKAAGAQAVTTEVQHDAEFEGWRKIEYFKMHFRPAGMEINANGLELGTLPDDLTPTKVMGDFLRYLYTEALEYIKAHHIDGHEIINEVEDNKSFILSLPNGWAGLPQQRMREAAVVGGLVKNDNEARIKIGFVSEGEASALSCLANGLCPPNLKAGYRFIIADAGGGTLDITSYEITKVSPTPEMKEITSSDCRFAGSVFVNMKAREFLKKKLEGTRFSNQEQLDDIINERFELDTKRRFSNISDTHWLKIGERQDNNEQMGLVIGKLRLEGTDIASFFDFSVTEALESIKQQVSKYGGKPKPVWLVGGFGGSPWLLKQLQEGLKDIGVTVSCHDTNLSKAVANGNVLFALEHTVCARHTRATFGIECSTLYRPLDPEHQARVHLIYESPEGYLRIPGKYDIIVGKGTEVRVVNRHSQPYHRCIEVSNTVNKVFTCNLLCYSGELPAPKWYNGNESRFMTICTIKADISRLFCKSNLHERNGRKYWKIFFEVELAFGKPELEARFKWVEKGETKYGPVSIFYD